MKEIRRKLDYDIEKYIYSTYNISFQNSLEFSYNKRSVFCFKKFWFNESYKM